MVFNQDHVYVILTYYLFGTTILQLRTVVHLYLLCGWPATPGARGRTYGTEGDYGGAAAQTFVSFERHCRVL